MTPTIWPRIHYWLRLVARLFLAFVFLMYAVAKIVGTQFIDSGPTMEKPVGELSGFEFTWAYFGYSKLFAWFVAGGQLTAAFLLLFDRTARLGAAILFPIAANIVIINFAFNISSGTKVVSVIYLALTLFLILGDWKVWKWVLWDGPADNPSRPQFVRRNWIAAAKVVVFAGFGVGIGLTLNGLLKHFKPRTPLSGDWVIERYTVGGRPVPPDPAQPQWRRFCVDGDFVAIVTDRGMLHGRIKLPGDDRIEVGYDPEVPAPPTAAEIAQARDTAVTIEEAERMLEARRNREWPLSLIGTYRQEGAKVIVSGTRTGQAVELVLVPLVRLKH